MKASHFSFILAACALVTTMHTHGQTQTGTMQRIQETGEIRLGHRDASFPFSYMNDDGKPIGFEMDLCARIVDGIKGDLKHDVKVVLRPLTLATAIPLLQNESVDIVCGPATNTVERQKQVAFSNTVFVVSIRGVVRRDSGINKMSDLAGKTVAMTAANTAIGLLTKYEQDNKFETRKTISPDHAQSFLLLSSGRAQAFVMDDVQLYGFIANSSTPAAYKVTDDGLRDEPYALMIRKDDPQFKAVVDRVLGSLMKSGEFDKLYKKWFESPVPPKNINLMFPMSDALKQSVAKPNDRGV
jgi:glutamate/aspartate transport system substrate-binding protein